MHPTKGQARMKVYFIGVVQAPDRLMVSESNLADFSYFQRGGYGRQARARRGREVRAC